MHNYGAIPRGAYRQLPKLLPRSLGFERYALSFKHTLSQYVDCGNDPSLDLLAAISIEFFVKFSQLNLTQCIISKHIFTEAWDINLWVSNQANIRVRIGGVLKEITPAAAIWTPLLNTLYHWVITYNGALLALYIDGVLVGSIAAAGNIGLTATSVQIGRWGTVGSYLAGLIPLVRIYDCGLTQSEVRWNRLNYHNPVHPGNIVLWLPMEEGAGLTVIDRSGHGNNGALLPALTPPTWEQVRQYELRAETE